MKWFNRKKETAQPVVREISRIIFGQWFLVEYDPTDKTPWKWELLAMTESGERLTSAGFWTDSEQNAHKLLLWADWQRAKRGDDPMAMPVPIPAGLEIFEGPPA